MAPASASAAKPDSAPLPLHSLNKASVKTGGTWVVVCYGAFQDSYTYTFNGKERQGTNFVCILISPENPACYCTAHFKKSGTNGPRYDQAVKTFKKGERFIMSKVAFADDAKPAYVSSPMKAVVDLSKTKFDPVVGKSDCAAQPAPPATVAGSDDLATSQNFDLTALIHDISEVREHDKNRSSFVVQVMDGSLCKDTKKVKIMPLRVYYDTAPSQTRASSDDRCVFPENAKKFLEEHMKNKTSVSFFCISGAQDGEGKFTFRTTKNTSFAPGLGTKAEKLNAETGLQNLQVGDTVAFELQSAKAAKDWSLEQGRETCCKLLSQFARVATGVSELDAGETIWQINWVASSEPAQGEPIKSKDGKRIWFPITLRDQSGAIILYITEQAALKLVGVLDAVEFEQLHSENRLRLPFWASVKVVRRPSKPSAEQPGLDSFDCFIVDALEQSMSETPSLQSARLLPMLSDSTDIVLPAALAIIKSSEHYPMAVQYFTQNVPEELTKSASKAVAGLSMLRNCSRAVALVQSSKRSIPTEAGTNGFKLVTPQVVDLLPAFHDVDKKYTLVSYCTVETVTDFKLDPNGRTKNQAALVSVTAVIDAGTDSAGQPVHELLVDNVQLLSATDAEAMKPLFHKMLYFAALAGQISPKRDNEWSAEVSPAKASKCRILGRSPTGPALPDYAVP